MPKRYRAYYRTRGDYNSIISKKRLSGDSVHFEVLIDSPVIRIGSDVYKIDTALYNGDREVIFYVRQNKYLEFRIDLDKDRSARGNYILGVYPIPQARGQYQFIDMKAIQQ